MRQTLVQPTATKTRQQQALAALCAGFVANGGKITRCPPARRRSR